MNIGFIGASGRTDASHATFLLAAALATVERGADLLVAGGAGHPCGGPASCLRTVRVDGSGPEAVVGATRVLEKGRATGRNVVADLPSGWIGLDAIRSTLDGVVIVVGPHVADERAAAALAGIAGMAAGPVWHLGCRRAGGDPAAARFAASMVELAPDARSLSFALPPLGRAEAWSLAEAAPKGRTLRHGLLLLAAVARALSSPGPGGFAHLVAGAAYEVGRMAPATDAKSFPDRLRDLADDVEAVEAGLSPTATDLAGAPALDGWEPDVVAAPILKGRASGHPGIPDGHRVRTSEVVMTDRATWARTMSRWYRLRRPEGAPAGGLQ